MLMSSLFSTGEHEEPKSPDWPDTIYSPEWCIWSTDSIDLHYLSRILFTWSTCFTWFAWSWFIWFNWSTLCLLFTFFYLIHLINPPLPMSTVPVALCKVTLQLKYIAGRAEQLRETNWHYRDNACLFFAKSETWHQTTFVTSKPTQHSKFLCKFC